MTNILWFPEVNNEDVDKVGGKAASLGEMYQLRLPIPPGFVVTAQAYHEFLQKNRIDKKIYNILTNIDINNFKSLQAKSKEIQEIILKAEMPNDIKNDILEAYDDLNINPELVNLKKSALSLIKTGRDLPYVAVRSSATAEDLPSISENEYVFVRINKKPFFGIMKELVSKIKRNDQIEVLAMDNFKVKWKKVSNIYRHKANNKDLYKITTSTGKQITISPNHSLIILDENNLEPNVVEVAELKGDEKIPVIKSIPETGSIKFIDVLEYINEDNVVEYNNQIMIKNNSTNWKIQRGLPRKIQITEDFAYFLGLYAAEGTTYKNSVIITNSDLNIINRIKKFLNNLGLNSRTKINKNSLRVHCKTLVRFLNENCGNPNHKIKGKGKICKTKQVPSFIFSCSKDIIGEYLKGCFDGDGTASGLVCYDSTSQKLIVGISTLLQLLNIEFYISEDINKNSYSITLPVKELSNFTNNIGFLHTKKAKKLKILIKKYNNTIRHFDRKNSINISKNIAKRIRESIENNLEKQKVVIALCPSCLEIINKSSKYKGVERYYCPDCRKAFYDKDLIKKEIEKYVNYDERGRFLKNSIPWNKAINTYPSYSLENLKKILTNDMAMQLLQVFDDSLMWDKIVKIEEIDYDSWVYDFCVPEVENFAAGIGNIITHNTASFAGQQSTFLNVKGNSSLLNSVKKCWASLFSTRAIYYREKNKFPHDKVLIAVVVQRMVNSESSGVLFTINPGTNAPDEIMIEAGFGLGELIVAGAINPDNYVIDKETLEIKNKRITKQDYLLTRNEYGKNIERKIPKEKQETQVLNDNEIISLAKYGKQIEEHYNKPMDVEFAIELGKIYIVQARPVTTLKQPSTETLKPIEGAQVLLTGLAASPGSAYGGVKIIFDLNELDKVEKGDILVTKMTNPDMVPAMERAAAVVTDEGGTTSHAAIVSRELGIPAIVGTEKATQILKDDQLITVDGTRGKVYQGKIEITQEKEEFKHYDTITKIKINLDLPSQAERASKAEPDGIGLTRIEFIIAENGVHPAKYIRDDNYDAYIDVLYNGLSKIAQYFKDKPIWVRTSDIRTDEYKNLEGAEQEPEEANPMLGWHGIRRGLDEPDLLRCEFSAIKKLHDNNYKNVGVMLPFVISVDEIRKAKEIMREIGLTPLEDIDFGIMIETPASVFIIEDLCKEGISFISFGTNDLTQTILGIGRGNERLQKLYDEMHPAVLRAMKHCIDTCKKYNVKTSICGQAGSDERMAELLVRYGIDSISVNLDAVNKIRNMVHLTEKKLLLTAARDKENV